MRGSAHQKNVALIFDYILAYTLIKMLVPVLNFMLSYSGGVWTKYCK
jgi:hypothetical protein